MLEEKGHGLDRAVLEVSLLKLVSNWDLRRLQSPQAQDFTNLLIPNKRCSSSLSISLLEKHLSETSRNIRNGSIAPEGIKKNRKMKQVTVEITLIRLVVIWTVNEAKSPLDFQVLNSHQRPFLSQLTIIAPFLSNVNFEKFNHVQPNKQSLHPFPCFHFCAYGTPFPFVFHLL